MYENLAKPLFSSLTSKLIGGLETFIPAETSPFWETLQGATNTEYKGAVLTSKHTPTEAALAITGSGGLTDVSISCNCSFNSGGTPVNLQCWCKPKRCHGHEIKQFIEGIKPHG